MNWNWSKSSNSRSRKSGGKKTPEPEYQNQIVWVDSDDVYQPISKSFKEFAAERNIQKTSDQVYIKENAINDIEQHLATNLRIEQGGILFGNAYKDPESQKIYVEITAAVPAPATMGTGQYLEFTSDSWLGIMNYAQRCHPQDNIVGWYHSHPNLGVFMSGYR
jgi:proteasome lid subunit RPN8/RPN11